MRSRIRVLLTASLVVPLVLTGCAWPAGSSKVKNRHWDPSAVAVRFVVPPAPQRWTGEMDESGTKLVADSSYNGLVDENQNPVPGPYHVALWGPGFQGNNVTYTGAMMKPGHYTFAFFDQSKSNSVQGWVQVNQENTSLLETLIKWKQEIPELKQKAAFNHEINGNLHLKDTDVFQGFAKDLRAFDRIEIYLDEAIEREMEASIEFTNDGLEMLQNSEVLVMESDNTYFHEVTMPAFDKGDMSRVRSGEPMTKMLFMADYNTSKWKLSRVGQLCRDLVRCRTLLMEETDLLERQKRLYKLVEHVFPQDRKFMENELRLQQNMAAMDRLNGQIAELSNRRLSLALVSALVATDDPFSALEEERRELMRELRVMETRKNRVDLLIDDSAENSPNRVILEQKRQNIVWAIQDNNRHLDRLAESRVALRRLRTKTKIIQRHADAKLLAASFVDRDIPFRVREAIEREALMTIRIKSVDNIMVPSSVKTASMKMRKSKWERNNKTHGQKKN